MLCVGVYEIVFCCLIELGVGDCGFVDFWIE